MYTGKVQQFLHRNLRRKTRVIQEERYTFFDIDRSTLTQQQIQVRQQEQSTPWHVESPNQKIQG